MQHKCSDWSRSFFYTYTLNTKSPFTMNETLCFYSMKAMNWNISKIKWLHFSHLWTKKSINWQRIAVVDDMLACGRANYIVHLRLSLVLSPSDFCTDRIIWRDQVTPPMDTQMMMWLSAIVCSNDGQYYIHKMVNKHRYTIMTCVTTYHWFWIEIHWFKAIFRS